MSYNIEDIKKEIEFAKQRGSSASTSDLKKIIYKYDNKKKPIGDKC